MSTLLLDTEGARPRATVRWEQYARWQLRDYVFGAGGATLAVSVLAVAALSRSLGLPDIRYQWILSSIGWLGSIFAVNSLVSNDRARGWYRFTFAKPVPPWRYYAQAFAIRGAGLVAIVAITWSLIRLLGGTASLPSTLLLAVTYFALFGSVTLLLSTLIRHEWLAVFGLYAASGIVTGLAVGASPAWRPVLLVARAVWPPLGLAQGLASPSMLLWMAGYSVAAFAAAMWMLRRREWAK